MTIPSLLLSPDESRDRNGPVTPTVGTSVQVVDGQYGQAWQSNQRTVPQYRVDVENPEIYIPNVATFTMMARVKFMGTPVGVEYNFHIRSGNTGTDTDGAGIGRNNSGSEFRMHSGGVAVTTSGLGENAGYWTTIAMVRQDGGTATLYKDGLPVAAASLPNPDLMGRTVSVVGGGPDSAGNITESALIFPEALSDAEIHRISTMPEAWTWEKLLPRIGGVRTVHDPAPFAVRSTHEEI